MKAWQPFTEPDARRQENLVDMCSLHTATQYICFHFFSKLSIGDALLVI